MRNFKFFKGYEKVTRLRTVWMPEYDGRDFHHTIDAEAELTRLMSEEIARAVDEDIINRLARRINGGRNNDDGDYLNYWMNIGGNRA